MDWQPNLYTLKRWSTWLQEDIDEDKGVVDTVNALIVVVGHGNLQFIINQSLFTYNVYLFQAAFIAGIQAQIITFTLTLPSDSTVGRISNVFAFVGLMLDVIGTFLGVIHAVLLQRRIQDNTLLLNATTLIKTDVEAGVSRVESDDSPQVSTGGQIGKKEQPQVGVQSQRVRQFVLDMQAHFPSRSDTTGFENAFAVLSGLAIQPLEITNFVSTVKTRFSILGTLFTFGNTPLISMGFGVACLIVSTILFAANSTSLLREVWIACVAVLVGVICLSLLPIRFVWPLPFHSIVKLPFFLQKI
jgi:hypothetical protein